MRGYFGIGVEGLSKPMNAGSLFRSAHAFGASFLFTVGGAYPRRHGGQADTSRAPGHVPFYEFADVRALTLPDGCALVGVEFIEEATELPSFRHPGRAAYVFGPERGFLTPDMVALCDDLVKIPTQFCVNVAVAGAIVMYDRLVSLGRFAGRPVAPGGPPEPLPEHVFGEPMWKKKARRRSAAE